MATQYQTNTPEFSFNGNGCSAKMKIISNNEFVVKAGAKITKEIATYAYSRIKELRNSMLQHLQPIDNDYYICNVDVICDSASLAGSFVAGKPINGNDDWKDVNTDKKLGDYRITPPVKRNRKQNKNNPYQTPTLTKEPVSTIVHNNHIGNDIISGTIIRNDKEKLIRMYGVGCQGCGRTFNGDSRFLEVDHIHPQSLGGANHVNNYALVCGPCNKVKSNKHTIRGLRDENRRRGFKYLSGDEMYYFD